MVTINKQQITAISSENTVMPAWKYAAIFIGVIVSIATPSQGGNGDYLEIELPKTVYQPYEPIVINITLHMDPPFEWKRDDLAAAPNQDRRLHHPLRAILKRDDVTVATAPVAAPLAARGGYDTIQAPQYEVQASAFCCMGNETGRDSISKSGDIRSEFIFFGEPGEYIIQVEGKYGGLHSNEASLVIVPAKDEAAAEAFASGGVDALALLLLSKYGEDAVETFKQIATNSPDSVYGAYAGISLALREAEKPYWARTSGRITSEEAEKISTRLIKQAKSFPAGHPLYNRAMLRAARYQFRSQGQSKRAKQTLQHLIETSKDSGTVCEATRILERGNKKSILEK